MAVLIIAVLRLKFILKLRFPTSKSFIIIIIIIFIIIIINIINIIINIIILFKVGNLHS